MNETIKTDVIIVGAGPTGLSLACQFIRYGVDFVIFDKAETIPPYSRAIGVQARTLEIYEQINLANKAVAQGAITKEANLIVAGETRGTVELSKIGEGLSPYPYLLALEQNKHEQILYDFIKEHGTDVLWQTTLTGFSQNEHGVNATIKKTTGETVSIEAKFLVGCDGARSFVRQSLGLTFEGTTFERLFYVADVEIDWQFSHDALAVCLAPNTITAFFPLLGENRFRIVGTFPENSDKREGEVLYEEIEQQIIADTKLKLDIKNVNWFAVYKVHTRRVNKFSERRCFVAGDAAHIHSPAGGQGMNTGIQDSYNLAWKIWLVLRGHAGESILETYNEERLENAKHLLETTDRMFDFAADNDWFVAYFRMHIFPYIANLALHFDAVKNFIFPLVSQIGINYRHSSLSQHANDANFKVKVGDRMPFFLIDNQSIYDKLRQPKFHLLSFSDNLREEDDQLKVEIENKFAEWVDFNVVSRQSQVAEIFGVDEPFIVLLRPDNYIGLITSKTSPDELRAYLDGFLGPS